MFGGGLPLLQIGARWLIVVLDKTKQGTSMSKNKQIAKDIATTVGGVVAIYVVAWVMYVIV